MINNVERTRSRLSALLKRPIRISLLLLGICLPPALRAQNRQPITIDSCYAWATANYPLSQQRDLIRKTRDYTLDNLAKGIYPQFLVSGSGSYQSAVTAITIPGYNIPVAPKDQYKIYGEVSQTLTDFGINKQKRVISRADADLREQNLNTDLYKLKDRINQLFFGVLLVNGQLEQNDLSAQDIRTGMAKVQAAISNGTDFNSSLNKLKAQLLQTEQHSIDLRASRRAYLDMLSLFINQTLDDSAALVKPENPALSDSINRPELKGYDIHLQSYQEQRRLNRLNTYPQLNAFFQGGAGQPSPLNFLTTGWAGYYITGVRLNWNFGALYTIRKDQKINQNNQALVLTQKNTFLFDTRITLHQQNADIVRYQQLIRSDDEIIRLRSSVKETSAVQLQNGVLSANDYLLDINAESQARQDRVLHEIQLLMSQYDHKTTSGN